MFSRALSIGLNHLPLASLSIEFLFKLLKYIPANITRPYLPYILPQLSNLLILDKISPEDDEDIARKKRK